MKSTYVKTLYDRRGFMIGWTLGFAALAALMTSFYPAMRQDGALDALVAQMPAAFQGVIGNLSYLKDFDTYIASQLFDIRMPLIAGIMAIILALGLSTREEEDGELRTMLALPISRLALYSQKWFALVTIMLVTSLGLIFGVYATAPLVDGAEIALSSMVALAAFTALIMVCYGTITFTLGMLSGKRSVAMGLSVLAIVGSFLLSTFGQAVDWLEKFEPLSLLHYFPAVDLVTGDFDWMNAVILTGVTLVMLIVGWLVFRRRDIA